VLLGYEIIHDTSAVLFLRCTLGWVVVVCRIQQIHLVTEVAQIYVVRDSLSVGPNWANFRLLGDYLLWTVFYLQKHPAQTNLATKVNSYSACVTL
jgi:hypothetical protein